jgi:hypothetical protein
MKKSLFSLFVFSVFQVHAEPPVNPALGESPWPIFHRNSYAQASGALPALGPQDRVNAEFLPSAPGGTSPWTVLLPVYADGRQAAIGSTRQGVVKHVIDGGRLSQVSYLPLPRKRFGFDWNLAVLRDGAIVTTATQENAFYLVGDSEANCANCPLVVKRRIVVPREVGDITVQFNIAYDGTLISLLDKNRVAAISLKTGAVLAVQDLPIASNDVSFHNAFPIDETGRIFLASQGAVTALDWRDNTLRVAWNAPYDFRGPGCEGRRDRGPLGEAIAVARGQKCTGTGTTPTLIGDAKTGVVVLVDGHAPQNRLVAFWRDEIPANAPGVAGHDRRVASVAALPYSTPEGAGFTAENSPAAVGNRIFIAQWAGFSPKCNAPRGVQRVDWLPDQQKLALVWANPNAHFNGVPTASSSTGLVYGAGYAGSNCDFRYRGLDIATGEIRLDTPLADSRDFVDQGNQHTIAADGSIMYATANGLVRLSKVR